MKIKYKLLCLVVFLLSGTSIFAQQNIITGIVTSPEGIFKAEVIDMDIEETPKATLTDVDKYSQHRPENEIHKLSLILKYSLL
ncbi:hypothetical protein LZ575_07525 [Antarcticibacterium sp. 1MA-6-2]|uniref:hypothetical protein n=1 Tax=Antarcticibacterium sp. 1MA-6-2 TaxID=2908210 RepID=UPI001F4728A8|nr:hypothetical protein [Antarcticibacterium sp. 1MA-6-2]UJH92367.1 hypothetical protein LZ575_07525 [Antarcticibacterium sp. 1MA-6-2]